MKKPLNFAVPEIFLPIATAIFLILYLVTLQAILAVLCLAIDKPQARIVFRYLKAIINAIPVLKNWTHLPVMVDPSHATGNWRYVGPVAKAAVAAGADGLLVEVHNDPAHALSDGPQSLKPEKFEALVEQLRRIAEAVDRTL